MKNLTINNFYNKIKSPRYSFVFFTVESCKTCTVLKPIIEQAEPEFPQIDFYLFDAKSEDTRDITRKYEVNYLPRILFFKDGEEVGKFYGCPAFNKLKELIGKVLSTGELLPDDSDSEEVTKFYKKIKLVLNLNLKECSSKEEMYKKAEQLMDISHNIIDSNPRWSKLNSQQLEVEVNKFR